MNRNEMVIVTSNEEASLTVRRAAWEVSAGLEALRV